LLASDKLVWFSEKDLCRQVPAQFAAERALDGDGLKGEFIPTGRNVTTTAFAGHHEQSPLNDRESECHQMSIGEEKAKVNGAANFSPLCH
jgi:hypothetical protein